MYVVRLAAPRFAPSAAPTRITPSVWPVMGTGPMKKETLASRATRATPASTRPASRANARARDDGRAMTSARTRRDEGAAAMADMALSLGGRVATILDGVHE